MRLLVFLLIVPVVMGQWIPAEPEETWRISQGSGATLRLHGDELYAFSSTTQVISVDGELLRTLPEGSWFGGAIRNESQLFDLTGEAAATLPSFDTLHESGVIGVGATMTEYVQGNVGARWTATTPTARREPAEGPPESRHAVG